MKDTGFSAIAMTPCRVRRARAGARPRRIRIRLAVLRVRGAGVLLLVAALLQVGCAAPIDSYLIRRAAEQQFSQQNTCPANRLAVKRLPVEPSVLFHAPAPPQEVAADPERSKLWNGNSNRALDRLMSLSTMTVTGCGIRAAYLCWDEWITGETEQYLSPLCYDIDHAMPPSGTIGGLLPVPEGWRSLRASLNAEPR